MTKYEVLVVDNRPLRERTFAEVQKILNKIEQLEEKIRRFHSSDQKLFTQWMDLTFRGHRERHEEAQNKYLELVRFHNWVVATAQQQNIEMHEAYRLMIAEQIRFNNGNEEERRKITLEREKREAYIREKSRSRYDGGFDYGGSDEDDSELIEGLNAILDEVEKIIFDEDWEPLTTTEERIERLMSLSEESLQMHVYLRDTSFMLFEVSLAWGQARHDYDLFKRVWTLMRVDQKDFFADVYASNAGVPIEELLQEIGLSPDWSTDENADSENDNIDSQEEEDMDEEPAFKDPQQEKSSAARKAKHDATTGSEEEFRSIFRKLMRKLHPDVHAADSKDGQLPPWAQRMWSLVQKAYGEKNLAVLRRLLKLTQIRMNALDELSISEIAEARHWLKKDFENLQEEASDLKNSMAWGFSNKKKYDSLKRNIEKDFQRNLNIILEETEELENQHQLLEMLAERAWRPQRRGDYRRKPRRRQRRNPDQQSLFED